MQIERKLIQTFMSYARYLKVNAHYGKNNKRDRRSHPILKTYWTHVKQETWANSKLTLGKF